ncbi:Transcriptional regulator, MarR family [Roseomonas mucosa]|mgnify:CR=1 FL=1|uniref:Salmolysin n=1 Tax=Roseomonas mucosa TaxID=207340 RepID=A0A379N119_9PROT|nr:MULTISPECIES: MarR family transcriptional regulator [Roseomonas]MBS5901908.1 MarR family transcriptional regulator [Acetobacteraceae bacterium]AWV22413.1 Transcriptional regulator, MarR family [Roseomonas mucosa]MCG7350161.1 MarR family transcriptional regulator [Roseomonas mucosa]MCG7355060.1 MarR family transcriptional regulator [Roseomonas mucosa]MDT8274602.1 MarR family transcriptional regulator [Roseomonas mucosa]
MCSERSRLAAEFGRDLFRAGQLWRREMDLGMRRLGLSDGTWRPLLYLGRMGGGIRQTDLAAALGIEGASLVRLLDALERGGLLRRHPDPEDRRSKVLQLTESGQETVEQIESAYEGVSQRLLVQIDEQELELCLRVFRKVELTLRGPGTAMESGPDDGLSGEVGA